jgi:leucyl-tRNA synthetase
MHKKFDSGEIEKKWQALWAESGIYTVGERDHSKPKEYLLVEWPYPSGNLHIGHWYAFAVPDIYARFKRMNGTQVLFPMGFDAFGLPAENAAIKRGLNPKNWTYDNMAYMREQLGSMGNMFSWDKTTSSTDPSYYKWTQNMFTKFFEKGVAYRGKGIVNWCPGCNTVIANEQVLADGTCERSGDTIEKREMPQWMLRITDYADRLTDDLAALDWPEHIKEAQRQWIGRSKGAKINFTLSTGDTVTVFTTRPDTLFGATYLVLAPEHPLLKQEEVRGKTSNLPDVDAYIKTATQKDEQDRLDATKEKTGVKVEGVTATNPASGEVIPVYVADYVLGGYGTGAIMAVPAHDERDFAFAKKFGLAIIQAVVTCADDSKNPPRPEFVEVRRETVVVHLRDKSTGKFALLNWHGVLEGTTTAIMGGIENGQTPEEAALAEMKEEAGLTKVTIVQKLPWITAARYCASHKQQNRLAHCYAFVAEIDSLTDQAEINADEQAIHSLVWVNQDEVLAKLTPDHQKQIWELLQRDQALVGSGYLINATPKRKVFGEPLPNAVPRVAVGSLVFDPKTGKYLAIQSYEFNNFGFIFGGLEAGETYEEAAIREALEETGYKTKFVRFITEETEAHFYHPGKKENRALVSRRVLLELLEDTPQAITAEESAKHEVVWLTEAELFEKFTLAEDVYALSKLHNSAIATAELVCDGIDSEEAKEKIVALVGGEMTATYRIRDWSIGRQRYWGVPIPIVYSPEGVAHIVPEKHLPWLLPEDVDFTPTGVAPLAKSEALKQRTIEIFGEGWTPEVETMDTFVDSSWYFLRYLDNANEGGLASLEKQKDWMPIDIYFGGAEHTTMHLLYSRFWQKALFDLGLVTESEPYRRRANHGMILGPDGNKMSKSKGNVIDPDEQVKLVGADTVKMYLAFMGPYTDSSYPWDFGGIAGVRRFLERVYGLTDHLLEIENEEMTRTLHKTIKKVTSDVAEFKFNTAISSMMIFVNLAERQGLTKASYEQFARLIAPFASHLSEEIWYNLGHTTSIHLESYPVADEALAQDTEVEIGVQINGKLRGSIIVAPDADEATVMTLVAADATLASKLAEGTVNKVIYKAGKILNIVLT